MKQIIYALIGCVSLFGCSDSYEDATSKHVYSESENPYLRVDVAATVTSNLEFAVGHFDPVAIKLTDYSDVFEEKMNMTVDQVISGLNDGSVVFYNINTTKNHWNKADKTKGSTGWYYNTAGGVTSESDDKKAVSLDFIPGEKALVVNAVEGTPAGTVLTFNVGFAVNGTDYDDYVRFVLNISVTDPSIILSSINIPEGDYNSFGIDFTQYADVINTCMGITVDEFLQNLDYNGDSGEATGKNIHMYVINPVSGVWDSTSSYTAESPGYWLNGSGAVCNWGDTGFATYANTKNKDKMLYIGRAPGFAAGTKFTISIGYKDITNENNFFRFIISITLE